MKRATVKTIGKLCRQLAQAEREVRNVESYNSRLHAELSDARAQIAIEQANNVELRKALERLA
jgi:hypothetical protein